MGRYACLKLWVPEPPGMWRTPSPATKRMWKGDIMMVYRAQRRTCVKHSQILPLPGGSPIYMARLCTLQHLFDLEYKLFTQTIAPPRSSVAAVHLHFLFHIRHYQLKFSSQKVRGHCTWASTGTSVPARNLVSKGVMKMAPEAELTVLSNRIPTRKLHLAERHQPARIDAALEI